MSSATMSAQEKRLITSHNSKLGVNKINLVVS